MRLKRVSTSVDVEGCVTSRRFNRVHRMRRADQVHVRLWHDANVVAKDLVQLDAAGMVGGHDRRAGRERFDRDGRQRLEQRRQREDIRDRRVLRDDRRWRRDR